MLAVLLTQSAEKTTLQIRTDARKAQVQLECSRETMEQQSLRIATIAFKMNKHGIG